MALKVGFLGAGIMGSAMARNIAAAGMEVRLWDRTREKAERVEGVTVADSPAAATDGADVLVTMVADGPAVESVASGALREGLIWLQMSTVGIVWTERLTELGEQHRVEYVDAPVVGTKQPAESGALTVLVSGPQEARERAHPVFEAVGSKIIELGESGEGTKLKLVVNNWLVSLVEGLAETIALAEATGLDPEMFLKTIEGGPLDSAYAQNKGRAMIERSFDPSFPLRLARKDAGLVLEAAERAGIDLRVTRVIYEQFTRAADAGHADEDFAATYYATVGDARVS